MPARRSARPVVLVTGATGLQGGSVARALLAEGAWHVRAMTRTPRSPAALALRAAGAEVVRGDLADAETLPAALDRAEAVYAAACAPELGDVSHAKGRALLGAIAASGADCHLVLSSLAGTGDATRRVQAAAPQRLERLEREADEMGIPSTFVHVALPFERFLGDLAPRRQRDGSWLLDLAEGDAPLASVSIEDAAYVVASVLARRREFVGRSLFVAGDELRVAGYAAAMARVLAAPVHVRESEPARAAIPAGASPRELATLLDLIGRITPRHEADIVGCRSLHPAMQRFHAWLARRSGDFTRAIAA